jgi:hypothetical protein
VVAQTALEKHVTLRREITVNQEKKSGVGMQVFVLLLLLLAAVTIGWRQSPQGQDTLAVEDVTLPLSWPLVIPSQAQVQSARECNFEALLAERYPFSMSAEDLASAFAARTACDWAVLSVAYANRAGEGQLPPVEGQMAAARSVYLNPAYALTTPVLFPYFGLPNFVEAPPIAQQPLTEVQLLYYWSGMGSDTYYDVTISAADSEPLASGTFNEQPYRSSPPSAVVQGLGAALTDLVPIERPLTLTICANNYPDWTVTLTYQNGAQLKMVTNLSNALGYGGPWQVAIDGQNYMQYSPAFLFALLDLLDALELPLGQPASVNCSEMEQSLLDMTYP